MIVVTHLFAMVNNTNARRPQPTLAFQKEFRTPTGMERITAAMRTKSKSQSMQASLMQPDDEKHRSFWGSRKLVIAVAVIAVTTIALVAVSMAISSGALKIGNQNSRVLVSDPRALERMPHQFALADGRCRFGRTHSNPHLPRR